MLYRCYKIIFFCLISFSILSNSKAQTEFIVTVNSTTGKPTKIDSIPGVRFLQSYSTYNQSTKEYTVLGTYQTGQSPVYLYTLNAETGAIISKPLLTNPNNIISMQFSRSTGKLYGIINRNGVYYLATINKMTGFYSLIKDIPGISGVGPFTIDETNQRLFLRAVDNNPNFALWTIDLQTGNIIYHVQSPGINELRYDNNSKILYGLISRPESSGFSIVSLATIDPSSGNATIIADLPAVTNILSGDMGTFNENERVFFFTGLERTLPVYLYSVNATTGNIISKAPISSSGVTTNDNLIFFRFDNISSKLYGLFWEARTVNIPPTVIDSSCSLYLQTKVYTDPSRHSLIVIKNPTICKVTMNIYSSSGQLMLKNKMINDGFNETLIDNFSTGIYFYELFSNNQLLLSGKILRQ